MEGINAKNVVIYGAGGRCAGSIQYLQRNSDFNIVGICDSDEKKHGMRICNFPVMNQREILNSFGNNFFVYISPASPIKERIQQEILEKEFVTKNQILNYSNEQQYLSCYSLETAAIIENRGILLCCNLTGIRNEAPYEEWGDSIEHSVESFVRKRDFYINALNISNETTPCTGCSALCNGRWSQPRKISSLALSLSYPCQLACIYCSLPTNSKYIAYNQEELEKAKSINIEELMDNLKKIGNFDPTEPIQLSGGEITIAPSKDKLLDVVSEYPLQIFTNAILFDERIAVLARRDDGSFLNISLDAGTKSTYAAVKGLDVFEKVIDTLTKYKYAGSHMLLKYIILPENCNSDDFDGFVKLVQELKPISVSVSCDIRIKATELPKEIIDGAVYLVGELNNHNIATTIMPYFGEDNTNYIKERTEKQKDG